MVHSCVHSYDSYSCTHTLASSLLVLRFFLYVLGLEEEENEASFDDPNVDANRKTRSAVVRTSTRQTIFLPVPGLVNSEELKPSDLVGTNKDSYLILEKLPEEFDSRVKAMEVDERPTEEYSDIGGCDQQIQELIEAVVLTMTHKDMFDTIGIRPPKGVLFHGPPGTGKTLLGTCLCQSNQCHFSQNCRTATGANVYWRWCQIDSGCL